MPFGALHYRHTQHNVYFTSPDDGVEHRNLGNQFFKKYQKHFALPVLGLEKQSQV